MTWELGIGLGHIARLRPIGQALAARGHRVVAAVQNVGQVDSFLASAGITTIAAPLIPPRPRIPWPVTHGFCQILANAGFDDASRLTAALALWTKLLEDIEPDLVVVDHSPTVLLALAGRSTPRVNIGSGFFCPPAGFPLPIWNLSSEVRKQLIHYEEQLTTKVNQALTANRQPAIDSLAGFYNDIEGTFLATYPEFDHFGPRPNAQYWGHWSLDFGATPEWLRGQGPRVYAYLKPFPALEALLAFLSQAKISALVVNGGFRKDLSKKYESPSLRFSDQPLNLRLAASQCDLAILNANHGTMAEILRAGRPCMLIPLFMEQLILARKVERLGAAQVALLWEDQRIIQGVQELLQRPSYRNCARNFAQRYEHWDSGKQIAAIVDQLEQLVA